MTDKELIQALRYCAEENDYCTECSLYVYCDCVQDVLQFAADRLEALLAENTELKNEIQVMKYGFDLIKSRTRISEPPTAEGGVMEHGS